MKILNKIKSINSYLYRNFFIPRLYDYRDRDILKKNLGIKNIHPSKRCFIIGNGPSVSDLDLGRLKNEYTFVMAEFEKNIQATKLQPKFHIITDSVYFTEGLTEYWPARFRAKDKEISPDTTMIINLAAKSFVEKYNLFKKHRVYYVGTQGIFTDNLPFNINLDHYVPYPKNSALMCMMTAVWMGFNEIYLLGCEHNFLSHNMGYGKSLSFSHSYDDEIAKLDSTNDEVLKKYIDPKDLKLDYEMTIANILQLFRNYRLFYAKARKLHPGLRIFNATPNSFLDVFPMIDFGDIKLQVESRKLKV